MKKFSNDHKVMIKAINHNELLSNKFLKFFYATLLLVGIQALTISDGHADTRPPESITVAVPGNYNYLAGCSSDWSTNCPNVEMMLNNPNTDDIFRLTTQAIPQGYYEYKVAINGSWDENYGAGGIQNGPNIGIYLNQASPLRFYYNDHNHVVVGRVVGQADSYIMSVTGNIQTALGCPNNNDATCLSSMMYDLAGSGIYVFETTALPAGNYSVKGVTNEGGTSGSGLAGDISNDTNVVNFTLTQNNSKVTFVYNTTKGFSSGFAVLINLQGDLTKAKGLWLEKDLIAIQKGTSNSQYVLHTSANGTLGFDEDNGVNIVAGGDDYPLTYLGNISQLRPDLVAKAPYLANFNLVQVNAPQGQNLDQFLRDQLKKQVVISVTDNGQMIEATALQIAGAIDDLWGKNALNEPLGPQFDANNINLKLWAPTARTVFAWYGSSWDDFTYAEMEQNPTTGVWKTKYPIDKADSYGKHYMFCVEVYNRIKGRVDFNCDLNDPYAVSTKQAPWAWDSTYNYSQLLDINDPALTPEGWNSVPRPNFSGNPEDAVIYEMSVRDFSAQDETVSPQYRGTYMGFTREAAMDQEQDSAGRNHLKALEAAGLTHVELMPIHDFNTVPENRSEIAKLEGNILNDLLGLPANSTQQRDIVNQFLADSYDWGYASGLYMTPEGSYATNPNDGSRVLELRKAVQALHQLGLRVMADVVYNHQGSFYEANFKFYDLSLIVPDYYVALYKPNSPAEASGHNPGDYFVYFSNHLDSQSLMADRLFRDANMRLIKDYKFDGFRIDVGVNHTVDSLLNMKHDLQNLTLTNDNVDGSKLLLLNEAFIFEEGFFVAPVGLQADAETLAGSGIGEYSNIFKVGLTGEVSFSDDPIDIRSQGLISGLGYDENGYYMLQNDPNVTKDQVIHSQMTNVRVGLTGSLADYVHQNPFTTTGPVASAKGSDIETLLTQFRPGVGVGLAKDPQEAVNYVSQHDGVTLFDRIQVSAPLNATIDERVRMHNMGMSFIMLAQGIPFIHAGSDILRSKSGANNTNTASDWFNEINWSLTDNNWDRGMPPYSGNSFETAMQSIKDAFLPEPSKENMQRANEHFIELLKIRKSLPLLRLRTANDIISGVKFHNTGANAVPGLIVMSIQHDDQAVLVVFNANKASLDNFQIPELAGVPLKLHPAQKHSSDPIVRQSKFANGTVSVPGRTTAVFVSKAKICHVNDDGSGNVLMIDSNALDTHLDNHPGDCLGGCPCHGN